MDIKVQDNNFYVVYGWMLNKLGLKGNALALYAIIYGFSQTANQKCTASQSYLAQWVGCSRATINSVLSNLEKCGLITKDSVIKGGVTYMEYTAIVPEEGCQNSLQGGVKKFDRGCQKNLHNNIDNNIDKNTLPTVEGAKPSKRKSVYEEIYSNPEYKNITEALKIWEKYCKDIGRGYKRETFVKWAKLLSDKSKGNSEIALAIVNQSIKKGWKDLYELKDGVKFNSVSKPFDKNTAQLADVSY